jgi:hypothetical protein
MSASLAGAVPGDPQARARRLGRWSGSIDHQTVREHQLARSSLDHRPQRELRLRLSRHRIEDKPRIRLQRCRAHIGRPIGMRRVYRDKAQQQETKNCPFHLSTSVSPDATHGTIPDERQPVIDMDQWSSTPLIVPPIIGRYGVESSIAPITIAVSRFA